jgi:hypothetical protein
LYDEISNKLGFLEIDERIKNAEFKIFPNCKVIDYCVLPNKSIFVTTQNSIRIFNEIFQETKNIAVSKWTTFGCAINSRNEIYISNTLNNCIGIYNLNLEKFNTVGSKGNSNGQFDDIGRMIWKEPHLYVCDLKNKRIQIFDIDLKFLDVIQLVDSPRSIQILNKTIGVCGNDGTYFYDLETKKLKNEIKRLDGAISLINSIFYVGTNINSKNKINCYDEDGCLIKEIEISDKLKEYIISPWHFQIFGYKKDIFLYSWCSKI